MVRVGLIWQAQNVIWSVAMNFVSSSLPDMCSVIAPAHGRWCRIDRAERCHARYGA